jgi:outer membrane protein TolC
MKPMPLIISFLIASTSLSSSESPLDVPQTQAMVGAGNITLTQFLETLAQTHPLFERELMNVQIAQEEKESLTGIENWTISSGANLNYISYSPVTAGLENTRGVSFTSSVSRHFWSSGGNLSAGLTVGANALGYSSDPMYSSMADASFDNKVSLSYTQPLLKNWKGVLSKLEYDLKDIEIVLTRVQILENQEDFLSSSAQSFLNWVYYTAVMQIVQERLQFSRELLDETKQKRERNLVDEVDVIRAKTSLSLSEQNRVTVGSNLISLAKQLSILTQDENLVNRTPEFGLYEIHELPELEAVIDDFKENSRVLRQLRLSLQQLEVVRRGNMESTKPDLNLTVQVATKKSDDSFGSALAMDKPEASLGLTYAFPMENTEARSDLLTVELQIAQLAKQIEELEITQISALTSIYVQLKQMEEILELNRQQIELAREKTVEETATYNRGRGDFTYVISSQDEEESAKLTYALNALTYQQLYIEYLALTDQLLAD